jgi:hypothetical protein
MSPFEVDETIIDNYETNIADQSPIEEDENINDEQRDEVAVN